MAGSNIPLKPILGLIYLLTFDIIHRKSRRNAGIYYIIILYIWMADMIGRENWLTSNLFKFLFNNHVEVSKLRTL